MNQHALFPIQASAQLSVHIKSLRKARGLTQAELGQRIGVKQVRIADIEKNPGAVSLDQLVQLLHALDAGLLLIDKLAAASSAPYPPITPAPAPVARSPAPADW
jgi:HTH-type transcriptional regulator/antitoxin HipB